MKYSARDLAWQAYTTPKGEIGNSVQGAILRPVELLTRRQWQRASRVVLIHTMGKVGSKALAHAVSRVAREDDVLFHSHRLVDRHDAVVVSERQGIAPRKTWYVSSSLKKMLAESNKPVVVLTTVRDPLERNISGFFQTIERYTPNKRPLPLDTSDVDVAELTRIFIEKFPHERITTWLDREILTHFDIDPFETEFDVEKGYSVLRSGNRTVAIGRHDRFPDAAEQMTSEALGVDGVTLQRRNTTAAKSISTIVTQFRAQLDVPSELVTVLYDSKYARHFGFSRPSDI